VHKIEVVVLPDSLSGVSHTLGMAKLGPFQVSDVTIFDPAAPLGTYRGARHAIGHERVKLELVVPDHDVDSAIDAIQQGLDGFGRDSEILVLAVEKAVRVSQLTGMRGRVTR